ncbi:unnamed protein product [Rotaria socialis]|uniref:EGF-like domain-containing protein n=1 Tax=Rotaria socialis TaxID=392032 RepID=A0A820GR97_9BILA|nr:unnamed protein product [Rotaria socialis]CAF4487921.1 unnamed protein product [Rotaria socialis]
MSDNHVSAELVIPAQSKGHRSRHARYDEQPNMLPSDQGKCNCSKDSLCVGIVNNRSICLCPLAKTPPRCCRDSICHKTMCMNGGLCVPYDDRISFTNFMCICQDGFSGEKCEHKDFQIEISFSGVSTSQAILLRHSDWSHACVVIERLATVILGVKFNLWKSKTMA